MKNTVPVRDHALAALFNYLLPALRPDCTVVSKSCRSVHDLMCRFAAALSTRYLTTMTVRCRCDHFLGVNMHVFKNLLSELRCLATLRQRPFQVISWITANVMLVLLAWIVLSYRAELQRRDALDSLHNSVVTLADSYSEHLARLIASVNEQTLTLKHYLEGGRASVDLKSQWQAGMFGSDNLHGIAITDKGGQVISSSFPLLTLVNVSTMPHFIEYARDGATGLRISAPSPGLLSGKPIIRFTRDLRTLAGDFDGVISIGCRPSYFASSFARSRLGAKGFLAVQDGQGTLYLRQVKESAADEEPMFSHPSKLALKHGFLSADADEFIDRVPRFVAWSAIEGTSLFAMAALSPAEALLKYDQSKRDHTHFMMLWALFLGTVCVGGLVLYARLLARSLDAERVKRIYRLATEGAGEGFYMLEPQRNAEAQVIDFRILDCNALGAKFMDFDSVDLIGKTISELHPTPYGAKLIALFRRALHSGHEDSDVRVPTPSRYNVEWIHRKMVVTEGSLAVTVRDITSKKQQERALLDAANTDSLTGVPNRHWLNGYLPLALVNATASETSVALYFIDLDNFKDINDTLGHHAGDAALRETAQRLRKAVRPQDAVVRLGGDEFTVVVEGIDGEASAAPLAERIVVELGKPFILNEQTVTMLRGSVGVSLFPQDASDAHALLRHADTAMYVAKTNGKSRHVFYSSEIGRRRASRLNTERELREAIARREFIIHYQPRVDAKTRKTVGAEALVRWQHPTRGLIAPVEFIPLAEQTGLILELGEIVIDLVLSQIESWIAHEQIVVPISINVSPIQFNRHDVAASLIADLTRRKISPHLIEVELTEAAMIDSPTVGGQFSALTQCGIKLLVDDFGTGYSSLAQMQMLRLDVLKVDQSLTAQLAHRPQAKVFYQAIVAMGHALDMTITAEGVETTEQLEILTELACDEIQGFIVARALPSNMFQAFLRDTGVLA